MARNSAKKAGTPKQVAKGEKKHPPGKRTNRQIEEDIPRISDMDLQGFTQKEIAEELNKGRPKEQHISRSTIGKDMDRVLEYRRESIAKGVQPSTAAAIAELRLIKRRAWSLVIELTKKPRRSVTVTQKKGTDNGKSADFIETNRTKDKGYNDILRALAEIQSCISKECKILGLEAPKKHQVSGGDGQPWNLGPLLAMPDDQYEDVLETLEGNFGREFWNN